MPTDSDRVSLIFIDFAEVRSSSFPSGRRRFRSRAGGRSRFSLSHYRGGFRSSVNRPNPPPPPPKSTKWKTITRDHFIISVVAQGFQISVQNFFRGSCGKSPYPPPPPPRDPKVHLAICKEIEELVLKNAIVQIDDFPLLCLSPSFVIPKKMGDLRIILNLKKINVFILIQHFRMETLNVIIPTLRAQDWAVSLDLKDAYLHVPVHPSPGDCWVSNS